MNSGFKGIYSKTSGAGCSQSALELGPSHCPNGRLIRARPGLWRICLCPKFTRIAEHKFANR